MGTGPLFSWVGRGVALGGLGVGFGVGLGVGFGVAVEHGLMKTAVQMWSGEEPEPLKAPMPMRLKSLLRISARWPDEFIQPLNSVWVATSSGKLLMPMFSPADL